MSFDKINGFEEVTFFRLSRNNIREMCHQI